MIHFRQGQVRMLVLAALAVRVEFLGDRPDFRLLVVRCVGKRKRIQAAALGVAWSILKRSAGIFGPSQMNATGKNAEVKNIRSR